MKNNKKKWLVNAIYILIVILMFSLSLFRYNNQVWIAAWLAPIFFIRFIRNNRWLPSVILGFFTLQITLGIGMLQMFSSLDMENVAAGMDISHMLKSSAQAGTMFLAIAFLLPFLLDKALRNKVPKFFATLIVPSGIVGIEVLYSITQGTLYSLAPSQISLPPFVFRGTDQAASDATRIRENVV